VHDLLALELIVVLGAAVLLTAALAPRLRVAPPVLQLLAGIALGFVPMLRAVHLPRRLCCCSSCRRCSSGRA
jgi:CPA1 family monovalent cation:H+ antiporter